jgi:hypothetical protein
VFAQALTEIIRRLNEAKALGLVEQYALIGGFAVSAWGVPRATRDLDFVLALGSCEPVTVARRLETDFSPGDHTDPLRGVFRTIVRVKDHSIPVQLILLPLAWSSIVFREVVSLPIFDTAVPVVSWQSLILMKLYAGGPQDLLDARQVLTVRRPTQQELDGLSALAESLGVFEAWRTLAQS